MKKVLILFFYFFTSFCVAHAIEADGDSLSSKWAIGVVGSLDFYKYNFQNLEGFNLDLAHSYQPRPSHYSGGITLTRKIFSNTSLTSGFSYSEKGFNRVTNPAYYTREWQIKEIRFYTYYLEIPFLIKYNLLDKNHWSLGVSMGSIISIPIRGTEHWVALSGDDTIISKWDGKWKEKDRYSVWELFTTNPPGRIHASWALSPSVSYKIKNIEFSFEPMYQYYFVNIYQSRLTKNAGSLSAMLSINYWF